MVSMALISCGVCLVEYIKIMNIAGFKIRTADLCYVDCAGTQESKVYCSS